MLPISKARIVSRALLVCAALGVAGCASTEKLAVAKGDLFPLNPDHWQATPDDLKAPPAGPK